jgi:hypothetical protein
MRTPNISKHFEQFSLKFRIHATTKIKRSTSALLLVINKIVAGVLIVSLSTFDDPVSFSRRKEAH